jgi:hypothetical protein
MGSACLPLLRRDTAFGEEGANVTLGRDESVCGFGFGDSNGRRDHVDPGFLFISGLVEAFEEGEVKEAFVQISKRIGGSIEGDDKGSQFSFAFGFLVGFVNAVEVGVA